MSTQTDYERYKKAMARKGKRPISFEQFRTARAHQNMGQHQMSSESNVDIADIALMVMIMSDNSDASFQNNGEEEIESFDEIEKDLADAGWMPDDTYEPVTSDDTTNWDSSGNDSSSWDSGSDSSSDD